MQVSELDSGNIISEDGYNLGQSDKFERLVFVFKGANREKLSYCVHFFLPVKMYFFAE